MNNNQTKIAKNQPLEPSNTTSSTNSSYQFALTTKALLSCALNAYDRHQQSNVDQIQIRDLFKRGYEYFIESFHLYDKPSSLQQSFQLYIYFFRAFIESFPDTSLEYSGNEAYMMQVKSQIGSLYLKALVKNLFFELMRGKIKSVAPAVLQPGFLKDEHLSQLRRYLLFSILKFTHSKDISYFSKPKELVALYKEDKILRDNFAKKFSFTMQKLLFAYYLNMCVTSDEDPTNSEFFQTLCTAKHDCESLDLLLKRVYIPLSFNQLVEESLLEFENLPPDQKSVEAALMAKSFLFTTEPLKLAPYCIELPISYTEFNRQYIHQKCSLCNGFSASLSLVVCLVCGEVICAFKCDKKHPKRYGNTYTHAHKFHMGLGLYFGIDNHIITIMSHSLSMAVEIEGFYIDKLWQNFPNAFTMTISETGQIPQEIQFQNYNTDAKAMKFITDTIKQHSMAKELVRRGV